MKQIVTILCTIMVCCWVYAANKKTSAIIPMLAWYSVPPGEFATVERYQELRDAGFTHTYSDINNKKDALKALDLAAKVGMKLVFLCSEVEDNPEAIVQEVKKHPGLAAYFLSDEPQNDKFEYLGKWARRIESIDKKHPCYLNLLPSFPFHPEDYKEHLRLFDEIVNLPQLSYDHYPIRMTSDGIAVNPTFWENLELVSAQARRSNKSFWAFALTTAHYAYPIPTIGHLRLQFYSDLAYGAQLLQHFTYWNPDTTLGDYHQAPITLEGKRSPAYELVREMNQEIQNRAFVFKGCKVESVYHLGDTIPMGTKRLTQLPSRFLELDTHGKNALISTLSNNGNRYVVIQNISITEELPLDVCTDNTVKLIRRDGTSQQASKYGPLFILPIGDILVFEY